MSADPVTVGQLIRLGLALQSLLPTGGGVPNLLRNAIGGVLAAQQAGGTPPLVPVPSGAGGTPRPQLPPTFPQPGFPGGTSIPDRIPGRVALPALRGFLTSGLALLITTGLLWPRTAGKGSDLRDLYAVPAPAARPRGRGRRRPRARVRPRPVALPRPVARPGRAGPITISRPRVLELPRVVPAQLPAPRPSSPPIPASLPKTIPAPVVRDLPTTNTIPAPRVMTNTAAIQVPSWLARLARLAPAGLAVPLLGNVVTSPNLRPNLLPQIAPQLAPQLAPLTQAQAYPVSSAVPRVVPQTDACAQQRARERRRRKKACKNPVTSSRTYERGGRRYQTVTRELKCPVSSRKKPRSPPAPSPTTFFRALRSSTRAPRAW